jgi:Icc protein
MMSSKGSVLSWLHIGDLHITAVGENNYRDLQRIVALAAHVSPGSLDFAVYSGDNADDGTAEQFALVRQAMAPLRLPLHVLPGDHDFKRRSLDAFYAELGAHQLPYPVTCKNYRCVFLDVVWERSGGSDFRLSENQLVWIERELETAQVAGESALIFIHSYPTDLREGRDRLVASLARPKVLCVDMGHTHYNELAHDGSAIFMTTRSTGQIEERPPGFSIAAVDDNVISWRFKPLDQAWPIVLITGPADRRLNSPPSQFLCAPFVARAKVIGDVPIEAVEARVNRSDWVPMTLVRGETALWSLDQQAPGKSIEKILRLRAGDALGRTDEDLVVAANSIGRSPARAADAGTGEAAIETIEERSRHAGVEIGSVGDEARIQLRWRDHTR